MAKDKVLHPDNRQMSGFKHTGENPKIKGPKKTQLNPYNKNEQKSKDK